MLEWFRQHGYSAANNGVLDEGADYEAIINTADIISILKTQRDRTWSGLDAETGQIVLQFSSASRRVAQHFRVRGAHIEGITPTARATERVVTLNDARRETGRARRMVESRGKEHLKLSVYGAEKQKRFFLG